MYSTGIKIGWLQMIPARVRYALATAAGMLTGITGGLVKDVDMKKDDPRDKDLEASFLLALDDHHGILTKVSRAYTNNPADREDLCQEIIYQLWKAFPEFNQESKVSTWIYTIALRTAIMPYRMKAIDLELMEELPDQPAPEDPQMNRLFDFLQNLENFERGIVTLMTEGYTQKEIGKMLRLTEDHVNYRMKAIKRKMKDI